MFSKEDKTSNSVEGSPNASYFSPIGSPLDTLKAVTALKTIKILEGARYRNFQVQKGSFIVKLSEGVEIDFVAELFPRRIEENDGFFTTVFRKKDLPEVLPKLTDSLHACKISYLGRGFTIPNGSWVVYPINRVHIIFNTPPTEELISSIEERFSIRSTERSRMNRSLYEFSIDSLVGAPLYQRVMTIKSELQSEFPSVAGVHLGTRRRLNPGRGNCPEPSP